MAGGLPGFSPATVDVDEKLDGARIRDQLDVADTVGTSSWSTVARLDGSFSPTTGTDGTSTETSTPATYGAIGGLR